MCAFQKCTIKDIIDWVKSVFLHNGFIWKFGTIM